MTRKTITIERECYSRLVAVQRPGETFSQTIDRLSRLRTNADALEFYRRKRSWLSPKKIALIEKLHARKQRSPRS